MLEEFEGFQTYDSGDVQRMLAEPIPSMAGRTVNQNGSIQATAYRAVSVACFSFGSSSKPVATASAIVSPRVV